MPFSKPKFEGDPNAGKRGYPKPKKGGKVKCLGCTDGKVMGAKGVIRKCTACVNGFIVAK